MGFVSFDQVHELWNFWEVRGIILFSLFLQTFLILVSPFRTKTANAIVSVLLWLAYLLADAAATFAVGLISHSQGESTSAEEIIGDLLAFWTPILIIHLGGPDTITALALEDNELWQRHLLQLLSQLAATLYILYKSLTHDSELLAPTLLVLFAGLIKYGERVYSLYLASVNKFRDSLLTKPDPGLNYARYLKQDEPTVEEPGAEFVLSDTDEHRSDIEMVRDGYKCYTKFKGLVADLIYSNDDWQATRKYFRKRNAEQAFRVVEIELNFLYEALYTKMPVIRTRVGYIFRLVCFVLVLASFLLWRSIGKSRIPRHDVQITYALLGGAITLDVITSFMHIFSDRSIAWVMKKNSRRLKRLVHGYLAISNPTWSDYSERDKTALSKLLSSMFRFCRRRCISTSTTTVAAKKGTETIPFLVKASRILFRRWCEGVQQFNLVDYTVNMRDHNFEVVSGWLGLTDFLDGIKYVSIRWFSVSLRDSIFLELKAKSDTMEKPEDADKICKVRGEWVLKNKLSSIENFNWEDLKPWLTDVDYDESLILWHIATEICYHHDNKQNDQQTPDAENDDESHLPQNDVEMQKGHESVEEDYVQPQRSHDQIEDEDSVAQLQKNEREISKVVSDYMLYLLIREPKIMTTVAGIGQFRFRDTCAEAKKFFKGLVMDKKRKDRVRSACSKLLEVSTDIPPKEAKGDRSKSLLFEGCRLAKELDDKLGVDKWNVIHKVWVEMLCYAATHCSGHTHAAQLSKGGQLITFVWLLMVHLGLGKQFLIKEGT